MVPPYPNELNPPLPTVTATSCIGNTHAAPRNVPPTYGLSARSCALGAASHARSPEASLSSPVIPAAGSACPMLALTPPTVSASLRAESTAATSDPASMATPFQVNSEFQQKSSANDYQLNRTLRQGGEEDDILINNSCDEFNQGPNMQY